MLSMTTSSSNLQNILWYQAVLLQPIKVNPWSHDWLIAAGAYPGFCNINMKRLGVFLLLLGGMLVHCRSLPCNLLGFPNNSPVPSDIPVLPKNTVTIIIMIMMMIMIIIIIIIMIMIIMIIMITIMMIIMITIIIMMIIMIIIIIIIMIMIMTLF